MWKAHCHPLNCSQISMFTLPPPGPWSVTVWGQNPRPLELLRRYRTITVHPRQGFMQPQLVFELTIYRLGWLGSSNPPVSTSRIIGTPHHL